MRCDVLRCGCVLLPSMISARFRTLTVLHEMGPKHILTASHVVDWTVSDGEIGWLRLEPDHNNGDVFSPSYATITYSRKNLAAVGRVRRRGGFTSSASWTDASATNWVGWAPNLRRRLGRRGFLGPPWVIQPTSAAATSRSSKDPSTYPTLGVRFLRGRRRPRHGNVRKPDARRLLPDRFSASGARVLMPSESSAPRERSIRPS